MNLFVTNAASLATKEVDADQKGKIKTIKL